MVLFVPSRTKFYITLSAKGNQKLSKLFSKRFERSIYSNDYETNVRRKKQEIAINIFSIFLRFSRNFLFVGVNRLFAFIYPNEIDSVKELRYYLLKGIIKNYNVSINEKTFYDQAIESDIKRYKETRKLATAQSKDYTIGCLLG